ncbi:MAG: uracil-xanthine permease [Clostridia bacterium]|nr:uracil-xanthine permease [Clostridia bacterium]
MKLIYDVQDRPPIGETIVFAFQQMIAIMAATLLVPMIMSGYAEGVTFDPAAALCGAGFGTIVYILFTKGKSPVFLGSSFTFLGAYAATLGSGYGYWGVIIGIALAGLVYVVIALIVKFVGSKWVNKILPPIIIGPIVALIGLSLSGTATGWSMTNGGANYNLLSILCALVTFFVIVLVSVKGGKKLKLIPFIIGIAAGYVLALIFTIIGNAANVEILKIIDFKPFEDAFVPFKFTSILDYPKFTFIKAIQHPELSAIDGAALASIALIFIPIGVVELAQHVADHKNLGNIINKDLISDPGLDKTLLGDGVGSMVGGFFGGAANTTYGESIGCVAITGNASIISIFFASIGCIVLSFFTPFVALINTIPKCVMGGACIALYGFIAVSGLQMLKKVDLGNNKNLFVVSAILVTGIGGLVLDFGHKEDGSAIIEISTLAVAMIVGIITNLLAHNGKMATGEEVEVENAGLAAAAEGMKDVIVDENTTIAQEPVVDAPAQEATKDEAPKA